MTRPRGPLRLAGFTANVCFSFARLPIHRPSEIWRYLLLSSGNKCQLRQLSSVERDPIARSSGRIEFLFRSRNRPLGPADIAGLLAAPASARRNFNDAHVL